MSDNFRVKIVDYNIEWPELFRREAIKITKVFGDELVDIHHIGSTSVVGLKAKPIIDIMPVVKDINQIDRLKEQMEELGYEALGEYGISGRRYFRKGGYDRTHHLHVFAHGCGNIGRHLTFRDYLRAKPDIASRYSELKAELASHHPNDIIAYMNGKDAFVKDIEKKALEWE